MAACSLAGLTSNEPAVGNCTRKDATITCLSVVLRTRGYYRIDQLAGSGRDLFQIAFAQGFDVDQVCAYPQCESPCSDEFGGIGGIYAAGGNQASVREWSLQRFQVFRATHISAGKNLDQPRTVFLSVH